MTSAPTLEAVQPGEPAAEILQRVLESAPDYSVAVTGGLPGPDAARLDLAEMPPGVATADKRLFAIRRDGVLVGWIDVVRGYPDPETAFIGLLVVAQSHRWLGIGSSAYRRLESIVRTWGQSRLRLAVVEANAGAADFWERQGFRATGERKAYSRGTVQSELLVMEKRIAGFGLPSL